MKQTLQAVLAAPVLAAVVLAPCAALCAGTAWASGPASWVKTNSCPPGYQINPQNSQQCVSLSPAGPETITGGCTSAGYSVTGSSPTYCVDANGRDTLGGQH